MNQALRSLVLFGVATAYFLSATAMRAEEANLTRLDAFIAEETAAEDSDSLLQTDRTINGLGFGDQSLLDIPRSVTPLSPDAIQSYQIDDVYDLARAVPGASVTNYYGVPGIPTTRGLFTSLYFNGMQRVWNRNGYPTSFGSLEAMEYVKGPPPPSYSAASPGGFVNFVPKSPYFDEFRGSVTAEFGAWDHYRGQVDVGGPFAIGDMPMAFRISAAVQEADSFYDGLFNDYTSVYGSIKLKPTDSLTIFAGGELYFHRSKENPGWNRVTQDLIDNSNYIWGNPSTTVQTAPGNATPQSILIMEPGGRMVVDRSILEDATPFGGTFGSFGNSFLSQSGFASSGFDPALYGPDAIAYYQSLGSVRGENPTGSTRKLSESTVLTDPNDFADADTYLAFLDFVFTPSEDFTATLKFFYDGYEREKNSTYGYAEYGENDTFETKLIIEQDLELFDGLPVTLAYGASLRYEESVALTDFTVEPFSRRDLTQPVSPVTVVPAGFDIVPGTTGTTYWDPFGSYEGEITTVGFFANSIIDITDRFKLQLGFRWDVADFFSEVPEGYGLAFNAGSLAAEDEDDYINFTISPSFKLSDNTTIYYTYQEGTSYQGFYVAGTPTGLANFQKSSLQEIGIRSLQLDGDLYLSATFFYQDLVNFDDRSGSAVPQRGKGVELEATYVVTDNFTVQANATWQEHHYRSDTIPGGFIPLTDAEMADYAGIFYADFGGRPNPGGPRFGIPEWTFSLLAKYEFNNGFGVSGGPTYVDSMYANPDKTLTIPDYIELNANIFYKTERFEIVLALTNLLEERYFYPSDSFAASAIITPAPNEIGWKLTAKWFF